MALDPMNPARTAAEVDERIERWHDDDTIGVSLITYLGWTWAEYKHWVETTEIPPAVARDMKEQDKCSGCGGRGVVEVPAHGSWEEHGTFYEKCSRCHSESSYEALLRKAREGDARGPF